MEESAEEAKRPRGAASLGELLEGVLANLDLGPRFREQLAVVAWPQVVGRLAGAHARAEAVRDGVLLVATDTPAWAQELHMQRKELLARLAAQVGEGLIREIHFRSGLRGRREKAGRREPRPAEMKLSRRLERRIKEAAERIEDAELRERAERAFLALGRMREWRRRTGWRRCGECGQWHRAGRRWCASCAHRRAGRGRR
jgi:predicted nucleic acid-binding Zn ribbon protein